LRTKFTIHTPINDFIAEDVRRTGIFEELEIDACCGGHRTLAVACAEKGIDPEDLLNRLTAIIPESDPVASVTEGMEGSLSDAVNHLLETHHANLKETLPRLTTLLDKVIDTHAARHPELTTIHEIFGNITASLKSHLLKEEQDLFPMIKQIDSSDGATEPNLETLQNPIRVLLEENERILSLFERMRATTRNFNVPEDGCESYRLLYTGLDEIEIDTLSHFQKEKDILFPQVLA
jgi:regulator of cell morphogenesis and NO signaling